ncbi:MAG: hypothetical protein WA790_15110 [Sulfitobacter sp.]
MSSILLSNPFVTPAPPPSAPQDATPALAVAPAQGTSAGSGAGNSTSFSGSGSGYSSSSDQQSAAALIRDRAKSTMARPADATGKSVVNAQTQSEADVAPFGSNLPKVEMPDPLPTSPFLLSMSVKD